MRALYSLPVLAFLPLAGALAQGRDTTRLDPIVVTGTRTPLPASSQSASVTVLDGETLRRAGVTTVADALRTVPSVALAQAGSYGAQTSLFLRGGENDFVRVLVDGVPLNQAGGFIDLAHLTTDNVERIEIVRGPASVLYGSDAVSGVIQVITRRGTGTPRGFVEGRGGSYSTGAGRLEVLGGGGAGGFSGSLQRDVTDGIHPMNSRYANTAASARLALTPDDRTDLGLTLRYRSGVFHYPTDGTGAIADANQYQRSRQATLSVDAGRRLSPRLEVRALLGLVAGRDSVDDAPDGPADTTGFYAYYSRSTTARRSADLRVNLRVAQPLLLTLGGSVDRESERSANSYASSFGNGGGTTDVARTNRALYLQTVVEQGALSVQAGARLDDNQRFGTFGTARVGGSLRVAPSTRLRVNAGRAFREPTFGEHYSTGFSVGNPNLRPEWSTSAEAGVEQAFAAGRGSVAVTGFTQRFKDLIQYTFAPPAGDSANYYNVASARSSGVEVEARLSPAAGVDVGASYTWLRTSAADSGYDGTVFAPGQRLLKRPAHVASLTAEWRPGRAVSAGTRIQYVGDRDDLDFSQFPSTRVVLPAYGRLDVWGQVGVARLRGNRGAVVLTARIDNLTGARYEEVYGFRAPGRRIQVGGRVDVRP